ncbi:unnamed protein product [Mesocestoides corti]|uniref:6-pyruvoyltetrahydropterin synthase n=1 Tax=Mesocestoides corti TaxID=53468 RepID=A0A0R3UQ23_MESCO|nr:unnamed protein product [Mesocestoides corti]
MSPRVSLKRVATFSAAHRLFNKNLTETENIQLYGKCANANGHGHNYKIEVTVLGEINPVTGMVMNLRDLKRIIQTEVLDVVDHKHLDLDVGYFRESAMVSTAENIVVFIWRRLRPNIDPGLDLEVTLHETESNIFCYRGN